MPMPWIRNPGISKNPRFQPNGLSGLICSITIRTALPSPRSNKRWVWMPPFTIMRTIHCLGRISAAYRAHWPTSHGVPQLPRSSRYRQYFYSTLCRWQGSSSEGRILEEKGIAHHMHCGPIQQDRNSLFYQLPGCHSVLTQNRGRTTAHPYWTVDPLGTFQNSTGAEALWHSVWSVHLHALGSECLEGSNSGQRPRYPRLEFDQYLYGFYLNNNVH